MDLLVPTLSFDNMDVIISVIGWEWYSEAAETLRKCSKAIALIANNRENYLVTLAVSIRAQKAIVLL